MHRALFVPLVALVAAGAGHAQNLLVNPDFATDIEGWSDPTQPWLDVSWNAEDWRGEPESGSARLFVNIETSETANISQCIEIPESFGTDVYEIHARARVGDGYFLAGTAELGLWYYESNVCDGFNWSNIILPLGLEEWASTRQLGVRRLIAPAGTRSIRFELRAHSYGAGGSFEAFFDHVYLPEPAGGGMALLSLGALALRRRRA